MPEITPEQLAAVLKRAILYRRDVKKCSITVPPDDRTLLLVECVMYDDRRYTREAAISRLGNGQTCGQIFKTWLGDPPDDSRGEEAALVAERRRHFSSTPEELLRDPSMRPVPGPPPSRLDWPEAQPEGRTPDHTLPHAAVPPPTPAGPKVLVKLTRQQMIDAGMDAQARHLQYKRQGGRHPDDA